MFCLFFFGLCYWLVGKGKGKGRAGWLMRVCVDDRRERRMFG